MGNPPRGNVVGKRIVPLPAFNQDKHLPWPSFAVNAQARKSVSAGQTPFTYALSALPPATITNPAANPPRIPVPPKTPPTIPQNAKRTAGPVGVTPQQGGAAPIKPANPALHVAPPVLPAFGAPAPPTQPRRVAGAIAPPGAVPAAPQYQQQAPVFPAVVGIPADALVPKLAKAAYILGWLTIMFGLFAGIPAIICGHLALRRANLSLIPEQVKRKARIGLALGYIVSFLWLLLIIWIMSS